MYESIKKRLGWIIILIIILLLFAVHNNISGQVIYLPMETPEEIADSTMIEAPPDTTDFEPDSIEVVESTAMLIGWVAFWSFWTYVISKHQRG